MQKEQVKWIDSYRIPSQTRQSQSFKFNEIAKNSNFLILQKKNQGKSEGFDSCDRPSNLKLDSNRRFFSLYDLEIWWLT